MAGSEYRFNVGARETEGMWQQSVYPKTKAIIARKNGFGYFKTAFLTIGKNRRSGSSLRAANTRREFAGYRIRQPSSVTAS